MRTPLAVAMVVVLAGASACARTEPAPAPPPPAPPASTTIAKAMQSSWETARNNFVQSAEVMPEKQYGFKPADSVRTYGQILTHVAGANYVFCAAAKGTKSPAAEDQFEKTVTTRAQIVKTLAESVSYCDSVFAGLTDAQLGEAIDLPFDQGKGPRSAAILGNIGHVNEHYGNLVTYMRIKGIVPPSSRR